MDSRDAAAFTILVREHTPMLMAYLRSLLLEPQAVEDVYQETMVTAWRQLESFDPERPFAAWVRGIARIHSLEHYRRSKRLPKWCEEGALEEIESHLFHIDSRPGDSWEEKVSALNDCLEGLAPPMHRVIELHYREGMTTEMMASETGSSREAVKKRLQRGRQWLLECLRRKSVFRAEMEAS